MLVFFYYLPLIVLGILLVRGFTRSIKDKHRQFRIRLLAAAAWILVVFLDLIVQEVWLFWACHFSDYAKLEQPDTEHPLQVVHIGKLDGPDCDSKCQRALYDYKISKVIATRDNPAAVSPSTGEQQNILFWLEPCEIHGHEMCLQSMEDLGSHMLPRRRVNREYLNLEWRTGMFPHTFRIYGTTFEDSYKGDVYASYVKAQVKVTWFSWPLHNLLGRSGSTCSGNGQFAYPDIQQY